MADPGDPDDRPSLEMPSFPLRRRTRTQAAQPAREAAPQPQPVPALDEPDEPVRRREPRRLPTVALRGLPAAATTGVAIGALAVLLAWLAGAGCSAVRGTSSCGGAAGLPVLLAGLVLLAWVGSLLLGALGVAGAGSTSALAVGILAVLVMVLLLGSLDEWWAAVAVPLLAAVAFSASWGVTTAAARADSGAGAAERHDVR